MTVMSFEPFGDPFRQIDRMRSQMLSGTRMPMAMPMDVWQDQEGYHVMLDLPGVDPDSVDITTERNMLTIRAERRPQFGPDQNVVVAERPQGTFTRQLQLGDALDVENVRATYANGVLAMTIPIAQSAQPRKIQVQQRQDDRGVDLTRHQPQQVSSDTGSEQSGG